MTEGQLAGPSLASSGGGLIAVRGPVTFATAGALLESGKQLFAGQQAVTVNLQEVTSVDSACLALLLEWLRQGRSEQRTVTFQGIPAKLLAIARLSGVEAMLTGGYLAGGSGDSGASPSESSNSDSSR